MLRREVIDILRKDSANGVKEAIVLMSDVRKSMPIFLSYPDSARRHEVEQYNSLVRTKIQDSNLRRKYIIRD